jgi:hypothetical protein
MEMQHYHKETLSKKTPWMNNTSCIMTCGGKIWVPLTEITCYIGYALELVTRKLNGIQYVLRTLGLANFIGSFRNQSSLEKLKFISQD